MAGTIALERLQAGLESVRGTGVAATRRVYGQRGQAWFTPAVDKTFLDESMSSFIKNYRHVVTRTGVTLGVPDYLTASDFAWWMQLAAKGGVTGVNSATTVYTYTFTPTAGSDDLKTATFEGQSDTQGYQFPYCLLDTFDVTWANGQPVQINAGLTAQQYIPQAVTGSISDRTGLNGLAGTNVKVFVDNAGGTIGTTPYAGVLSGKWSLANNWTTFSEGKGNLYFDTAVREVRSTTLELDIYFQDTIELAALASDVERLIRVQFTGPVITGSTGNIHEAVNLDFYGYHLTAAFSPNAAVRMVKMNAESQFDTTSSTDWAVSAITSNSTLP
jgi:hypothetical protein